MTEQQIKQDRALKVSVVARRLSVDTHTVYNMLRDKRLTGFRIGEGNNYGIRIYESSVLAMMRPKE